MSGIKLKEGHKKTVVGFNNSAAPLGERDDLHLLLIDAKRHNVKHLLDLFDEVPSEEDLQKLKGEAFLKKKGATIASTQTNKEEKNEPPAKQTTK